LCEPELPWIKDGGDVVTLSKRLGHSTPQVTMTTYAHDIEEANDSAARKAHVEAMFGSTKMAALMAATDGGITQETAEETAPNIVLLPGRGDEGQQDAAVG
jgi:hypothetical protein